MGDANPIVTLYSAQSEAVLSALARDGACFSKREYVAHKYEESAPIFLAAYDWFVAEAAQYLPKPPGAEYPYWAFRDPASVDGAGGKILKLRVPAQEAVFFDLYDWIKILRLQYIGETAADETRFRRMLAEYGIRRESDVILTNFYPDLKRQVQESWKRLFLGHAQFGASDFADVARVQAGLWQLRREWVEEG